MRTLSNLDAISDGKKYDIEDLVKADTRGCQGCSVCCHHSGDLITLTPFDVYALVKALQKPFSSLLKDKLVLYADNKVWLPHLQSVGQEARCSFLGEDGRCSIHGARPNICRLFPLGRVYEENDFKYFLQVDNCVHQDLTEVKVRDWINIADYEQNKQFLLGWYQFLKALTFRMKFVREQETLDQMNDYLLNTFYEASMYVTDDFYSWFWETLPRAKKELGIL